VITLPGIDVSSYNGSPGQWKGEAGNIAWAAVKFSELAPGSPYTSPDALADWAALHAMGCGRVAYLFGHPSAGVAETVDLFLSALRPVLTDDDGVALDLEVSDGRSPAEVAAWALDVLRLLEHDTGRKPYCYTFTDFAAEGNCAGLEPYPLWIADPNHPAGKPAVPAPWTTWSIHQYVITGPIDRDVAAYPSLDAMRAAMGKPAPRHEPRPEEPMLLPAGQGKIHPVAFRNGDTKIRFFPGATSGTELRVEFDGHTVTEVMLGNGAQEVDIPKGALGCRVTRADPGLQDVGVVTF